MTVEDCKAYLVDHPVAAVPFREKNITLGYDPAKGFDATRERKWNRDIDYARGAMESGILPDNTSRPAVEAAIAKSEAIGTAYRSDVRNDLSVPLKEKYGA